MVSPAGALASGELCGFSTQMVLEATIGFNRRDEASEDEEETEQVEGTEEPKRTFETTSKCRHC